MDDGSCEGCFYALPTVYDNEDLGMKCHRFPPILFLIEGDLTQAFPDAVNKCGEYFDPLDDNCDGCVHAFPTVTDDGDVTTKCRRYPLMLVNIDGHLTQSFPGAVKRCGEYIK